MNPDVLGQGWTAQTLSLRPDAEGPVTATLVRRTPVTATPASRRAVLYLHGFVDYFFQTHLGDAWAAQGFDFYALDLRKHGRSLRAGQTPNHVTDLGAYDEEIDEAIRIIRLQDSHDFLVMLGHSTGGLIAALWADRHRGQGLLQALVLNSPWVDLNGTRFEQTVMTRIVDVVGRFAPRLKVASLAEHYGRSLHRSTGGDWDYDLAWKPIQGFPVRAGLVRTIRRGHARLKAGLHIDCPVLVCASTASGDHRKLTPQTTTTDVVLNVDHMVEAAPRLGQDVTVVRIPDGVHDLALSGPVARQRFFAEVFAWLKTRMPPAA